MRHLFARAYIRISVDVDSILQRGGNLLGALPISDGETSLDTSISDMFRQHPDQNGLSLLANNLHAFAARVHSARSAGRSLDLQYYYWKNDLTGGLLGKEIIAAAERGVRIHVHCHDTACSGTARTNGKHIYVTGRLPKSLRPYRSEADAILVPRLFSFAIFEAEAGDFILAVLRSA